MEQKEGAEGRYRRLEQKEGVEGRYRRLEQKVGQRGLTAQSLAYPLLDVQGTSLFSDYSVPVFSFLENLLGKKTK